ncbi:uncharacterized protein LOC130665319 [Microplitis mediator]|uniref:uncharacterized protein LOC130665319 n=1 Tax=Microplitis mediator TaxID=375433 RepID=UPI002557AE35|nr:uncharacterized protein LOC130665319 [Microplitis mediator]
MDAYKENGSGLIRSKFIDWMIKSFNSTPLENNNNNNNDNLVSSQNRESNIDTTSLICLLQSIGFQLKKFDKIKSEFKNNENNVRVTIECDYSGFKADLEFKNSNCTCPQEDTNASMWNISGTGKFLSGSSTSINDDKFIESGSNLLPQLDKDLRTLIRDVLEQLILLINNYHKGDQDGDDGDGERQDGGQEIDAIVDQLRDVKINLEESNFELMSESKISYNSFLESSFTRCRTAPEISKRESQSNIKEESPLNDSRRSLSQQLPQIVRTPSSLEKDNKAPSLMRQSTFELKNESNEPRSSPPKISSSPVTLCSSLSQVSFPSDDGGEGDCFTLQDCLNKAAFYLEKARKISCMKNINDECSSIGFNSSQQDDVFLKPRQLSRSSSLRASPVTVRKAIRSECTSPSSLKPTLKPQVRRSIGNYNYSALKETSPGMKTGVSPVTLSRIKQNTTPKLLPRTRSIGTPSPTLKLAIDVAKKRSSIAACKPVIAKPVSGISRPTAAKISPIIAPKAGIKYNPRSTIPASSFSSSASTSALPSPSPSPTASLSSSLLSVSSVGKSEKMRKNYSPTSLSSKSSVSRLRKIKSPNSSEIDIKTPKCPANSEVAKKKTNYFSTNYGLKK